MPALSAKSTSSAPRGTSADASVHPPELLALQRLIETETLLAIVYRLTPDLATPLSSRHDTADSFVFSRVERRGNKWLERHWGDQLHGGHECETLQGANEHSLAAFEQMFPEHRCTERCCL